MDSITEADPAAEPARAGDGPAAAGESGTREQELLDLFFDVSADFLCLATFTGRFTRINATWTRVLGWTQDELMREPFSVYLHPDDVEPTNRLVNEQLAAGRPILHFENRYRTRDGRYRWLEWNSVPVPSQQLIMAIARDITEAKEQAASLQVVNDELALSNADLKQFAYVASHDLQEPLRMVASYLQLLARRYQGRLDDDADEYIAFAVDGATRMQALISDLLAYSSVGQGDQQRHEPVDTAAVVARVLDSLRTVVADRGAHVVVDALPVVLGDAGQLAQLFQNLLSNALKFHGEAPPAVRVSAERRGDLWQFAVADNGIGIERGSYERVFAMFQRLHARSDYAGTGIGLAVCKKVVERHGGRIWIEPPGGGGTTFSFTLPAAPD